MAEKPLTPRKRDDSEVNDDMVNDESTNAIHVTRMHIKSKRISPALHYGCLLLACGEVAAAVAAVPSQGV